MTTVAYQIHIDASVDKVWNILADFGGTYKWNPGVTQSYSTSANNSGLGATRHCDLKPAGSVEERIIEWNEGVDYTLEVYEGKGTPPFKKSLATFSVKPDGTGTMVSATVEYSLKYGPIGVLMNLIMVGPFVKKAFQALLAGLKHHAETGQEVKSARGLEFAAVAA